MARFFRVSIREVIDGRERQSYSSYATAAAAENLIKFLLNHNEDVFARLGHMPNNYITADPSYDIVEYSVNGD
jgi:hypothetical protein